MAFSLSHRRFRTNLKVRRKIAEKARVTVPNNIAVFSEDRRLCRVAAYR
jgi:hypothetical protein